jgi:class 3 adenylate cyclase
MRMSERFKYDVLLSHRRSKHSHVVWRRFQNSTPKTYGRISLEVCRLFNGPELPDKAFAKLDTLQEWYRAILCSWLNDSLAVADFWQGRLPSQEHEMALLQVVLEARNTGVRRIQRLIFRDLEGIPRNLRIASYSELSRWCDFMFELLDDDEQFVEHERQSLTFRYDKGVAYRLEEERKDLMEKHDEWVAESTHSMMKSLCKGKPHEVEPDDDRLIVIWSSLADAKKSIRETTVALFIDAKTVPKRTHVQLLEDIISVTWKLMRQLGTVCRDEPQATNPKQIRKHLDAVKRFCVKQQPKERIYFKSKVEAMDKSADRQRDFKAFVVSAKGETSTKNFQEWVGGERVTLAIVFTDVVGSTALGEEIKEEAMNEVRRTHFAQSRKLIANFKGREIKTIGDSFMAAFKCVDAALDYAVALQSNTGHPQVQIRAGIHIGPMQVEEGDVFGDTVNFAARVVGTIKGAEIWLSDRAKEDINRFGAKKHARLKWGRHDNVAMKGFSGVFTLWSLVK